MPDQHQSRIVGFTASDGSRVELTGKTVSVSNQTTHTKTVLPVSKLAWATIKEPETGHCATTAFGVFCVLEAAVLFGATASSGQTASERKSAAAGGTMAVAYVVRSVYHNCLDKPASVSLGYNGESAAYNVFAGQQTQNAIKFFGALREKLG